MKKNRLLEIIREEIAGALGEAATTYAGKTSVDDLKKDKAFSGLTGDAKADSIEKLSTGGTVTIGEDQLNEIEQLAEMASMIQLKNQLEKQGKTGELEAVKAAEKATIDKLKQNPTFSGEGKNARLKGYVSALKKELKSGHDINLQDLLTTVMLDAEAAGDKFKDDISTNTIEKDAAAQVLGTEKGQRGRKAGEKKEEAPKAKSEPKSKSEPEKSTSTVDSAEDKALKAAEKADKNLSGSGKYAQKLTPEQEELFKTYKRQALNLVNKIEDAESGAEKSKLSLQLKSLRNTPEVAALFKAKGVNI